MTVQYPKGEIVWVEYRINGEAAFLMTSKASRDFYLLYKVKENGSLEKLGKAKTPTELEKKFGINAIMLKKQK